MSRKKLKLLAVKVLTGETTLEIIKETYGEDVANEVEAIINANQ